MLKVRLTIKPPHRLTQASGGAHSLRLCNPFSFHNALRRLQSGVRQPDVLWRSTPASLESKRGTLLGAERAVDGVAVKARCHSVWSPGFHGGEGNHCESCGRAKGNQVQFVWIKRRILTIFGGNGKSVLESGCSEVAIKGEGGDLKTFSRCL